jgi:hypothetical protein
MLTKCTKEHAAIREGGWIRKGFKRPMEDLRFPHDFLSTRRLDNILKAQAKFKLTIEDYIELLVLQIHHRTNSNLYRAIKKNKPEIPVVVPMRDPLLSINTRIWRETGAFGILTRENKWTREHRAKDQVDSLTRLLDLPKTHVHMVPVDIFRTDKQKIKVYKDVIGGCNLTPLDTVEEEAAAWEPVNPTANGTYAQRTRHKVEDSGFIELKEDILSKNMEAVQRRIGIEVEVTRKALKPYIPKLKALGYKDLPWW